MAPACSISSTSAWRSRLPMMKAYIQVRSECEAMIRESGMNATILRPWYVLGPGHRWPYLLLPVYKIMELAAGDPPGCDTAGTGYLGTDVSDAGPRRRNSFAGSAYCRSRANPRPAH